MLQPHAGAELWIDKSEYHHPHQTWHWSKEGVLRRDSQMSDPAQDFTLEDASDREKLLSQMRVQILLLHTRIFVILNQIRSLVMSGTVSGASSQIATLATDVASLTTAVNSLEAGYAMLLSQVQTSSTLTPADQASLTASINQILADTSSAVAVVQAGATGATGSTGGATGATGA